MTKKSETKRIPGQEVADFIDNEIFKLYTEKKLVMTSYNCPKIETKILVDMANKIDSFGKILLSRGLLPIKVGIKNG